ncbi:MAG: NAD(P)/FAD-dependent oxidoreductase [Deltaproteobacteria bacterium]
METVEHLVIGAGPAGLRAAQVLAEAGREVLVLEKNPEIGPKTCAGGLTLKAVRELGPLGLPPDLGLTRVGHVAFTGRTPRVLDPSATVVRTVPRRDLGRWQLECTRKAGAEVRAGAPAAGLDLESRCLTVAGRRLRYRHLFGADGADSAVRRALGLPHPRACFAAEYNVPGLRLEPLRIECDPDALANGYFWVFPHERYTSIGAVAPKKAVAPAAVRRYLSARASSLGANPDRTLFEAATLEVLFAGFDFPNDVHLVGDAAGVPSALTAEGIYSALITGEETARRVLEPDFPSPKTRSWLKVKRAHDRLSSALGSRVVRGAALGGLARLAGWRPGARRLAAWFLDG